MMKTAIATIVLAAACTKPADQCTSNIDCTDPAYPFCDVNGEFPASGGNKDVCTIPPPADAGVDAPIAPGGCSPGAATCTANTLSVCNSDGMTLTNTNCALGCEANGTACKTFVPSNGLGPALTAAASAPDVVFPASVTINTDSGTVVNSGDLPVDVTSIVITQTGAPSIRAFIAHSFDITNAVISGANAVAFVSATTVTIHGDVDASANGASAGPGALTTGFSCVGGSLASGGGGGGNATAGGRGSIAAVIQGIAPGNVSAQGGSAQTTFSPLVGGCTGGGSDTASDNVGDGGGGGGGMQIVAGVSVDVESAGIVNLGGGGGQQKGGGGAGGNVIFESPRVTVDGIVAANGGSGGVCEANGNDGTSNLVVAPSVVGCMTSGGATNTSGAGGTANSSAGAADNPLTDTGAGGGGSVGRVQFTTATGSASEGPAAIESALVTAGILTTQ